MSFHALNWSVNSVSIIFDRGCAGRIEIATDPNLNGWRAIA